MSRNLYVGMMGALAMTSIPTNVLEHVLGVTIDLPRPRPMPIEWKPVENGPAKEVSARHVYIDGTRYRRDKAIKLGLIPRETATAHGDRERAVQDPWRDELSSPVVRRERRG